MMNRKFAACYGVVAVVIVAALATGFLLPRYAAATSLIAQAQPAAHGAVIQVDSADRRVMVEALAEASNIVRYFADRGQKIKVEIVANGNGLHMFRVDTSPVKALLALFHAQFPQVTFDACGNTLQIMEAEERKKVDILPEARIVPSGAGRIVELEQAGWAYLKP